MMSWYLERLRPESNVPTWKNRLLLTKNKVDIGTSNSNDLIVNCKNSRVGKLHAKITFKDKRPFVTNLGYQIDIPKEIALARSNALKHQEYKKIIEDLEMKQLEGALENEKVEKDLIAKFTLEEPIPREPPGEEFIKIGASFCQFDADSLEKPAAIKYADTKDFLRLYHYLRNTLQDASEKEEYQEETDIDETVLTDSQEVLEYILYLASVHQDELIVDSCAELLLEFNHMWEMSPNLIVSVFRNWGADISKLTSPRKRSTPSRIVGNNPNTVSDDNVNAVLRVFSAQLELRKKRKLKFGHCSQFLFGALILLSLDKKFIGCFPENVTCLRELLNRINEREDSSWIVEYSKKLLVLETDDYNLTWVVCTTLNGCLPAERLRVTASIAAVQRIWGRPSDQINYQYNEPWRELMEIVRSITLTASLKPLQIYCLLIFLDTIIRDEGKDTVLRKYYRWLERLDGKVGTNPYLVALISTYRVLWDVGTVNNNR